jgi:6-phosphogluconolactonase
VEPRLDRHVEVYPDPAAARSALARHLLARARASVRTHGRFRWVLAGGQTPRALYEEMARRYRATFPWEATELYFGDERCVSPRSPDSNYAMVRSALLTQVPIPPRQVHRMPGEVRPASTAAAQYARLLGPLPAREDPPRFDLVLLGLGPDGHTASLFPGDPALRESTRSVVSVPRSGQPPYVPRLSLTLPALNSSAEVCLLVSGLDKSTAVSRTIGAPAKGSIRLPATLLRPAGPLRWFLDRAAAYDLPSASAASRSD